MKIDPVRLARQQKSFNLWIEGKAVKGIVRKAIGIIEAVTGFGKTFIMILAIKQMNQRHADRTSIIVVPTTKLLQDWTGYRSGSTFIDGHIQKHNLQNVKVFVVNTYVRYSNWECDFLGLDECHHYANDDSQYFSSILRITKYKFLMAMSATLSARQRTFFLDAGIPVVDTINEAEAQASGYTAPSIVYNLGIELSEADKEFNEEINDKFKFYFSRFNHEFELVKACNGKKDVAVGVRLKNGTYLGKKTPKEWIAEFARINKYDGTPNHPYSPELIQRNAAQCMSIMIKRKDCWQNFPSKLHITVKLIKKFKLKAVCFCETSAFADKLANLIGPNAVAYHSNLSTIAVKGSEVIEVNDKEDKQDLKDQGFTILGKTKRQKLALEQFTDPNSSVNTLVAVRALDEGVDIPTIDFIIQVAYSSTTRQDKQRNGRAGRIDYDNLAKKALIINLYMKGTQEERWLREKQKSGISPIWVNSIEDINPTRTISLGTKLNQIETNEISINESDIESGVSGNNSEEQVSDSRVN